MATRHQPSIQLGWRMFFAQVTEIGVSRFARGGNSVISSFGIVNNLHQCPSKPVIDLLGKMTVG